MLRHLQNVQLLKYNYLSQYKYMTVQFGAVNGEASTDEMTPNLLLKGPVEVIIKLNMNRVFVIEMNATIIITVNCRGKERSPD